LLAQQGLLPGYNQQRENADTGHHPTQAQQTSAQQPAHSDLKEQLQTNKSHIMPRNSPPIQIEDELPHEIYAGIVASSVSRGGPTLHATGQRRLNAPSSSPNSASRDRDRSSRHTTASAAAVISTEVEDLPLSSSSSQFMQFYHRSCT